MVRYHHDRRRYTPLLLGLPVMKWRVIIGRVPNGPALIAEVHQHHNYIVLQPIARKQRFGSGLKVRSSDFLL
jgi:hypothetical protein